MVNQWNSKMLTFEVLLVLNRDRKNLNYNGLVKETFEIIGTELPGNPTLLKKFWSLNLCITILL